MGVSFAARKHGAECREIHEPSREEGQKGLGAGKADGVLMRIFYPIVTSRKGDVAS